MLKCTISLFLLLAQGLAAQDKLEKSLEQTHEQMRQLLRDNPTQIIWMILGALPVIVVSVLLLRWICRKLKSKEPFSSGSWGMTEILVFVIFFLLCQYLTVQLLMFVWQINDVKANYTFLFLVTMITDIISFLVIFVFLRYGYKESLKTLGFERKISWKIVNFTILSYVFFIPLYLVVLQATQLLFAWWEQTPDAQRVAQEIITAKGLTFWLATFVVIVVAPLCEEFLFRVFFYTGIRNQIGFWPALILSSVLFALVHQNSLGFLPIFSLGIYLAILYECTQSFWVPAIAHCCHNSITLIFLLAFF